MSEELRSLTELHNFAVVQLPDRRYPGVVFRGDSLHIMHDQLIEATELLRRGEIDNATNCLRAILAKVTSVVSDCVNGRPLVKVLVQLSGCMNVRTEHPARCALEAGEPL